MYLFIMYREFSVHIYFIEFWSQELEFCLFIEYLFYCQLNVS